MSTLFRHEAKQVTLTALTALTAFRIHSTNQGWAIMKLLIIQFSDSVLGKLANLAKQPQTKNSVLLRHGSPGAG
jgi:hypothetical protein